ncbi:repeat protein [Candidatus Magnetomorum sp. HK-1]|nr:repeat protein [Candidatus Magnetomorum sp. HK-1]
MKNSNAYPLNQTISQKLTAFVLFWTFLIIFCSVSALSAKDIDVCASGACDYTRIQDAIDAEPSDITIIVRPGRYTETVIIGDYWNFNNTGDAFTKNLNAERPNHVVRLIGAKKDVKPLWELNRGNDESIILGQLFINTLESGVIINGFTIDGSIVEVPDENHKIGTSALMIASGPDAIVQNNIVINSKRFGIRNGYVNAEGHRVNISNNTIILPKETAILNHVGNNNVKISDNYIQNTNGADGIASLHYENFFSENIQILNNKIRNGYKGIFLDSGPGALISGNVIEETKSFAILTQSKSVISGNTVTLCKDGIRTEYIGTGPSDRVEITGNTISYIEYSGINVCGAHTFVSNNILEHCNIGSDWDYASIHVEKQGFDAKNSIIQNNTVSNGINGIQVWADNVVVEGNTLSQFGKSDGGDYSDVKYDNGRKYENSAIVIGTNFGEPLEEIDPINLNIQTHADTYYNDKLNPYPTVSAISEKIYTIEENTPLKNIQFLIEDEDNDTISLELKTSNTDLIAISDMTLTATTSLQKMSESLYIVSLVHKKSNLFLNMMPKADQTGIAYIKITVDDSSNTFRGRIEEQLFTVNVEAKKYPPVVKNISDVTIAEGDLFANIILDDQVSDQDHEYTEINWTVTGQNNLVVNITDRIVNITAKDINWNGSETIVFKATDPDGLTSTDEVIFTVTPVNDPPILSNIADQSIAEGMSFTSLTLNDYVFDVDNSETEINWTVSEQETLTISIVNSIARITPKDENWNGSETIIITAMDPDGLTSMDSVIFTVTPVNDAPEISAIPDQSTEEGKAFENLILDNFVSDVDNADTDIDWTITGQDNLIVTLIDRIAYITAKDENWSGSETLIFKATDSEGLTSIDSIIFTVTEVNDAPVVSDIADQTIAEGQNFSILRLEYFVTDVDNTDTEMSWAYSGQETLIISIDDNTATITTKDINWNGSETILFIVTDPEGLSSTDSVTFTVTPVNDAPEVSDITDQTISEGQAFQNIELDNYVSDIDNSNTEINWTVSGQDNIEISIVDSIASITAKDENWNGSETLLFIAKDPAGLTSSDSVIFTVTGVNDAPVVSDIVDQTIEEGQVFSDLKLNDYVSDIDNDDTEISWTASGQNNLVINIEENTAVISKDENWNGSETILFIATDPEGLTSTDTVIFTVTAINDAPVISDIGDQSISEGQTFSDLKLDDFVSDVDNDDTEINWTVSGQDKLEISIVNRIATITVKDENWSGSEEIVLTAFDPDGLSSTETVLFTITEVNDVPEVSDIPDQSISEGDMFSSIRLDYFVYDIDNEDTEISWTINGDDHLVISIQDRTAVIMAKDENWNGSETILFIATDPDGLSSTDTVVFTVTAINDAPEVSDITNQYTTEGQAFSDLKLDMFVSDIDNEDTEISWTVSGQDNLIVSIEDRIASITAKDENWNGTETLLFTATDPDGLSSTTTVIYTVTAVNDAPEVSDIPDQSTEEGQSFSDLTLDDLVYDVDNTEAEISWTVTGQDKLEVSIIDRIASITAKDENWNGSETIIFTATDPEGLTSTDSVLFTVTPINDAPEVSDIPDQSIPEGQDFQNLTLDNYISDVDNEKTEINWTSTGQDNLMVNIEGRIAIISVKDENWNGSEALLFTATDPDGLSSTDTVNFTVTAVNDAPEVSDIPDQFTEEGQSFSDLTLDDLVSDVDNTEAEISWTVIGQDKLEVSIIDRIASITAKDENWNGSETIIFTATDPEGLTSTDSVIFTVTPINDAPEVSGIPDQSIPEGQDFQNLTLDNYISDVDNEKTEINWTSTGQDNLMVNIEDRIAIISVKDENWNGSETLLFTATDPDGLSSTDTVNFTVTAVNDAPEVSDIPDQSTEEGQSFTNLTLNDFVSDIDNTDTEISWAVSGQDNLDVVIDDKIATITVKDENWYGSETLVFTATDPEGLTSTDSAIFTVTPINDAPEVSDIADQSIAEGGTFQTLTLDNFVSDVDNDDSEIKWSANGQENLTVSIINRIAEITVLDSNWYGSETIRFTATDPDGLSSTNTVLFTVTPVNDAPELSDIADQSIAEGESFTNLSLDDLVYDPDNTDNEITWSTIGQNKLNISFIDSLAKITVNDPDWNGSETITFVATDPEGLATTNTVIFTVTPVNDPPVLDLNEGLTVPEGSTLTINENMIKASDIEDENDMLTINIKELPKKGSLLHNNIIIENTDYSFVQSEISAGNIQYQHDNSNSASDSFTFQVQDSENAEIEDIFIVTIENINDSPELVENNVITVTENKSVTITENDIYAKDEETSAESLVYSIGSNPEYGILQKNGEPVSLTFTGMDIKNQNIVYVHNGNETPTDSFELYISDKDEANKITIGPIIVQVSIIPENDPPTIETNSGISVLEGDSINITSNELLASDADNNPGSLKYQLTELPVYGKIYKDETIISLDTSFSQADVNANLIRYVHDGSETQSDYFIFKVNDGADETELEDFKITIIPVNDPPQASDLNKSMNEDEPLADSLLSTDPENDSCTYQIVEQTSHGMVHITNENDGSFTYTPELNYNGTDHFTYQVSDDDGAQSNLATVTINISPVNDAPSISQISNQTLFSVDGQSKPITINITDPETPSEFLDLSIKSSNSLMLPPSSFIIDGLGQTRRLTIVPVENVMGQAMVNIKVTDENEATATTSFQVSVIYSDTEPPVISLSGDQLITIAKGTTFVEPGVSAVDNIDGDISEKIVVESQLDTETSGTYQIKYLVSDQAGNEAIPAFRTILVYTVEIQNIIPQGNVVDENGDPIAGVQIASNALMYTSLTGEEDGSFEYAPLTQTGQIYRLIFSHDSYETVTKKFSGKAPYDLNNLIDIMMLSKESDNSALLSGMCLEYQTNAALEDVQINVFNTDTKDLIATTQSNANGMYTIVFDQRDLSMSLIVKAVKYGHVTQEASLNVDKSITADFSLPKKTILTVDMPISNEAHQEAFNNQMVKVIVQATPAFNGSSQEFAIDGPLASSLTPMYTATSYIIQYTGYHSFSLNLKADTTEDRNILTGYEKTLDIHFAAIPQSVSYTATIKKETIVTSGQSVLLKGDDQKSKTLLEIPANDGFEADLIPEKVEYSIQEYSGYTAVAGKIVSIEIKDQDGYELGKEEEQDNPLKKIFITLEYPPTVTPEKLLDGTFRILHAESVAAIMANTQVQIVSIDQILRERLTDDTVTFWVTHLSSFAIQEQVVPVVPPSRDLPHPSSNCFIQTTAQVKHSILYSCILMFGLFLGVSMIVFRRNRKQFGTLFCLFSLSLLIFAAPSWAKIQANTATFSLMSGGLIFEQNKNVGDGPIYGLGLGYHLTPQLGAEFIAIYGQHNVSYWDDANQVVGFEESGSNLYHLNVHYYLMPKKIFVPYLNLGISKMDFESDAVEDDSNIRVNYGFGAKIFLNEIIALRGDLYHIFSLDDSSNQLACTVGMTFQLGAKLAEKKKSLKFDKDGDGVMDIRDECPQTPKNVIVNRAGCPKDSDMDGVYDNLDDCPNTPPLAIVDRAGCPKDSDQDGIYDHLDHCIHTPRNMDVDSKGCPSDQDGDDVPDYQDTCPNTPDNATVDKNGCPIDQDADGVLDHVDQCPKTPSGTRVDEKGCKLILDQDKDGVPDNIDKCLNTKPGTRVNSSGCKPVAKNLIFVPYVVQVSSYPKRETAHKVAMKYQQKGESLFTSMIKPLETPLYSIFYGVYRSKHEAEKIVDVLKQRKFRDVRLMNLPYAIHVQPNEVYVDDLTVQKQLNKRGFIPYEIQGGKYGIKHYVGAYSNYKMAQKIANQLSSDGFNVRAEKRFIEVSSEMAKDLPYVFLISAYPDREKAFEVANKLRKKGDPTFTSYQNLPDTDEDYEIYYGFYQTSEQTRPVSEMLQKRRFKRIELKRKPYAICAGIFNQHNDLKQLETALAEKGYLSYAIPVFDRPDQVKVFVGAFKTKEEANDCLKMMKADGFLPSVTIRSEKRTPKTIVQPYPAFMDTDRDGVSDALDKCADTPPNKPVNTDGCQKKQKDVLFLNKQISYPYTIQVSEYSSKMKAYEVIQKFRKKGDPMYMSYMQMPQLEESYGVFYGYYPSFDEVKISANQLKQRNFRRVDILNMPFVIQLGIYDDENALKAFEKKLYKSGYVPYRLLERGGQKRFQVLIGAYKTIKGAQAFKKMLESDGFKSTIIKRSGTPVKIPEVPLDKFKDNDNDGISDEADKCPGTKDGEIANQDGCSIRQISKQDYRPKKSFSPLLSIDTAKKDYYPYTIRVSSYMNREAANQVAIKFRQKGDSMYISYSQTKEGTPLHDVFFGFYRNFEEAQMAALALERRRFKNIEMIKMPYAVQVGIFDSYTALVKKENDLMTKGYLTYSIPDRKDNSNIRLLVGAYPTEKAAEKIVTELKSNGFQPVIVKR